MAAEQAGRRLGNPVPRWTAPGAAVSQRRFQCLDGGEFLRAVVGRSSLVVGQSQFAKGSGGPSVETLLATSGRDGDVASYVSTAKPDLSAASEADDQRPKTNDQRPRTNDQRPKTNDPFRTAYFELSLRLLSQISIGWVTSFSVSTRPLGQRISKICTLSAFPSPKCTRRSFCESSCRHCELRQSVRAVWILPQPE